MFLHKPTQSATSAFSAEVDITEGQVVAFGTGPTQVLIGAANAQPVGIATESSVTGANVDVCLSGPTRGISGGAIAIGNLLAVAAAGRLVAITIGDTTPGLRVVGTALSAAAAAGEFVSVFIGRNSYVQV